MLCGEAVQYMAVISTRPFLQEDGSFTQSTVGVLDPTRVTWQRMLDTTSEASVEINVAASPDCCGVLAEVVPVVHELAIIRNGAKVWEGPILTVVFRNDQVRIEARDLSWWFERRVHGQTFNFKAVDASDVFLAITADALEQDNPNLQVTSEATGVLVSRTILLSSYKLVGDTIRELSRTGIDWTVHTRAMIAGKRLLPFKLPRIAISEEHISGEIEVQLRGLEMATQVVVRGDNAGGTGVAGSKEPYFGLVTRLFTENTIKDTASGAVAAQTRLDTYRLPVLRFRSDNETSLPLLPSFDLDVPAVIPGAEVVVSIMSFCRPIAASMRLKRLSVTADGENGETAEFGLIPLGTNDDILDVGYVSDEGI